jgi:hypothetical protein
MNCKVTRASVWVMLIFGTVSLTAIRSSNTQAFTPPCEHKAGGQSDEFDCYTPTVSEMTPCVKKPATEELHCVFEYHVITVFKKFTKVNMNNHKSVVLGKYNCYTYVWCRYVPGLPHCLTEWPSIPVEQNELGTASCFTPE